MTVDISTAVITANSIALDAMTAISRLETIKADFALAADGSLEQGVKSGGNESVPLTGKFSVLELEEETLENVLSFDGGGNSFAVVIEHD